MKQKEPLLNPSTGLRIYGNEFMYIIRVHQRPSVVNSLCLFNKDLKLEDISLKIIQNKMSILLKNTVFDL